MVDLGDIPEDINLSQLSPSCTLSSESSRDSANTSQQSASKTTTHGSGSTVQQNPHIQNEKPVCRYYRQRNCKYGRSGKGCPFSHPKVCMKFVRHGFDHKIGCNKGRHCNYFHPTMCKLSLQKKACPDLSCRYPHIKGTKRGQPTQDQPQYEAISQPRPHTVEVRQAKYNNKLHKNAHETERTTNQGSDSFLGTKVDMLASKQEKLQQMVTCLVEKLGQPAPQEKRCCNHH